MVESHWQSPALSRRDYRTNPESRNTIMVGISKRPAIRHRPQITSLYVLYSFNINEQLGYRKFQSRCLYRHACRNSVPIYPTGCASCIPGTYIMATCSPESEYTLCHCYENYRQSSLVSL